MLKFFKHLKALNRQRITNRRKVKFETVLSNKFDRANLELEYLRALLAKTSELDLAGEPLKKFAVYSTYFGASTTKTFNKAKINTQFDHYFISNNEHILKITQGIGWHPIFVKLPLSNNRVLSAQQSKVPKALPHLFPALNNYELLLYVDDKIEFDACKIYGLSDSLMQNNYAMTIREHPSINANILNEFAVSMIQPRYQSQRDKVVEYITQEIKRGRDLQVNHLYWTSAILRNMHHPDTKKIGENWYQDILDCGIECQISFDFIAQQYKTIGIMPQDIT